MGETTPIQLTYATREEAWQAYRSGLRYGVLTCPFEGDLQTGQRVVVDIQLPFARWGFEVGGEVGDLSPEGAVIYLDLLPSGLVNLFTSRGGVHTLGDDDASTNVRVRRPGSDGRAIEGDTVVPGTAAVGDGAPPEPDQTPGVAPEFADTAEPSEDSEGAVGESRGLQWDDPDEDVDDSVSIDVEDSEGGHDPSDPAGEPNLSGEPSLASVDAGESLSMLGPMEEGIPLPQLEGRSLPSIMRLAGSVGPAGWSPVLFTLVREEQTGVLVVDCVAARYWVYFREGFPVHLLRRPAASQNVFEVLATEHRMLEPDVARRCRYLAQVTGRSYMSVVARLGLLDEYQIRRLRQQAASRELAEMLTQIHGSYRFFSMPELRSLFHHAPAAMVAALVRAAMAAHAELDEDRAVNLLRRHGGEHAYPTELGRQLREQFGLDKEGQRLLRKLFDRDMVLRTVAQSESGEALPLIRLVLALYDLGLLELGPEPAGDARDRRLAIATLQALQGRLGLDLFALIGCHWADDEREIERGLKRAREVVAAVAPVEGEPADVTTARAEVEGGLERAATCLLSSGPRRAYRDQLVEARTRRLASAQLAMEGAIFRRLDLKPDARARLMMVLELDPGGAGSAERTERVRKQLQRLS